MLTSTKSCVSCEIDGSPRATTYRVNRDQGPASGAFFISRSGFYGSLCSEGCLRPPEGKRASSRYRMGVQLPVVVGLVGRGLGASRRRPQQSADAALCGRGALRCVECAQGYAEGQREDARAHGAQAELVGGEGGIGGRARRGPRYGPRTRRTAGRRGLHQKNGGSAQFIPVDWSFQSRQVAQKPGASLTPSPDRGFRPVAGRRDIRPPTSPPSGGDVTLGAVGRRAPFPGFAPVFVRGDATAAVQVLCAVEQGQLDWLITNRSQVQVLPALP